MNRRLYAAVFLVALAGRAPAAEVGPTFYMNTDFGGDTLVETNKGDVTGGGIIHFAGGLSVSGYAGGLETDITFGMKADSVSAENGTVSFYRWPIEVMQFYRKDKIRIGGGLTYHLNPKAKCDVDFTCSWTVAYENALGYVGQIDWVLPTPEGSKLRSFSLGLRYTVVEYKPKEAVFNTIDGNSIGFSLGFAM